jgi:septum formation protein
MTLWRSDEPLLLASRSNSRQMLLREAGIPFEAVPADIDERGIQKASGLIDPGTIARTLAALKAEHVAEHFHMRWILGADQTLSLGGKLFSKPAGRKDAFKQLRQLAGKTHELHSGLAIVRHEDVVWHSVSVARLTMRPLTDAQIEKYLDEAGDKVTASVGAYQLERLGVHLFDKVEGDHFTILGLPLLPLLDFLRSQGLLAV